MESRLGAGNAIGEGYKLAKYAMKSLATKQPDAFGSFVDVLSSNRVSIVDGLKYSQIAAKSSTERADIERARGTSQDVEFRNICSMADTYNISEKTCKKYFDFSQEASNKSFLEKEFGSNRNGALFTAIFELECLASLNIVEMVYLHWHHLKESTEEANFTKIDYFITHSLMDVITKTLVQEIRANIKKPKNEFLSRIIISQAQCLFVVESRDRKLRFEELASLLREVFTAVTSDQFQNDSVYGSMFIYLISCLVSSSQNTSTPSIVNEIDQISRDLASGPKYLLGPLNLALAVFLNEDSHYFFKASLYRAYSFFRVCVLPLFQTRYFVGSGHGITVPDRDSAISNLLANTYNGFFGLIIAKISDGGYYFLEKHEQEEEHIDDLDDFLMLLKAWVDVVPQFQKILEDSRYLPFLLQNTNERLAWRLLASLCHNNSCEYVYSYLELGRNDTINLNRLTKIFRMLYEEVRPIDGLKNVTMSLNSNNNLQQILENDEESDLLLAMLECLLGLVSDRNSLENLVLYEKFDLVEIFPPLLSRSLPPIMKGVIFRILSLVALLNSEESKRIWQKLEEYRILGSDLGGVILELDSVESVSRRYNVVDGFLDLLNSLLHYDIPMNIGFGHRIPGPSIYLDFVINEIIMKTHFREYFPEGEVGASQCWKLAAKGLRVLTKFLRQYSIEEYLDESCDPTLRNLFLGDFQSDLYNDYFVNNTKIRGLRVKSPGFVIMAAVLGRLNFVEHLLEILDECSFEAIASSGQARLCEAVLEGLEILRESPLCREGEGEIIDSDDEDLSFLAFSYSSGDSAYWKTEFVAAFLQLFLEVLKREKTFVSLAQKSGYLTITRVENGRVLSIPIVLHPLSHLLITSMRLETISSFMRICTSVHHPSIPIMTVQLLQDVAKVSTGVAMEGNYQYPQFTSSLLLGMTKSASTSVECVFQPLNSEIIPHHFPVVVIDHPEITMESSYSSSLERFLSPTNPSLDSPLRISVLTMFLSSLTRGHLGLVHKYLGIYEALQSSTYFSTISDIPRNCFDGLFWLLNNLNIFDQPKSCLLCYELLFRLLESPVTCRFVILSLCSISASFFQERFEYFLKTKDLIQNSTENKMVWRHCVAFFLDSCALIVFKCLLRPMDLAGFSLLHIVTPFLQPFRATPSHCPISYILEFLVDDLANIAVDFDELSIWESHRVALQLGQVGSDWYAVNQQEKYFSGFSIVDCHSFDIPEEKLVEVLNFNESQRVLHSSYHVCQSWSRYLSVVFSSRTKLLLMYPFDTVLLQTMSMSAIVDIYILNFIDYISQFNLHPHVVKPLSKCLLFLVDLIHKEVVSGKDNIDEYQRVLLLKGVLECIINPTDRRRSHNYRFVHLLLENKCELQVALFKLLQIPFEKGGNRLHLPGETPAVQEEYLQSNAAVLEGYIGPLAETLALDCHHGDADSRLTALVALNQVLLTLGPAISSSPSSHQPTIMSKIREPHLAFFQCVQILSQGGHLRTIVSFLSQIPSWSTTQSIWSSAKDLKAYCESEAKGHDEIFAAVLVLCSHIAVCNDDGFEILRESGLFDIIRSLPYFVLSPPTNEELELLGLNSTIGRNEIEGIAEHYFLPVLELFCTLASVSSIHFPSVIEEVIEFLFKNVQSVEHFLKFRMSSVLNLMIVERLLTLINVISHGRESQASPLSALSFSATSSAPLSPTSTSVFALLNAEVVIKYTRIESRLVADVFNLLKIFGISPLPSSCMEILGIVPTRRDAGFDFSMASNSPSSSPSSAVSSSTTGWWSFVRPTRSKDMLEQDMILKTQGSITWTVFDESKASLAIRIVGHLSSILRVRLQDTLKDVLTAYKGSEGFDCNTSLGNFQGSWRVDIITLIRSFNNFAQLNRRCEVMSSSFNPESSSLNLLIQLIHTSSSMISEDLLASLFAYLKSIDANQLHIYVEEVRALEPYAETFPSVNPIRRLYRQLKSYIEVSL